MANITKRIGKDGKESYLIRVSSGYGMDGKQRRQSMTWTPPAGISQRKLDKLLMETAMKFEEKVNAGVTLDASIHFQTFAEKWLEEYAKKHLKIKTWTDYEYKLIQINQGIGHIKLKDLKPGHLNAFYTNLQEKGIRRDRKRRLKTDLTPLLKKRKLTVEQLAAAAGISVRTVRAAVTGENISSLCADSIAQALEVPCSSLFMEIQKKEELEANTIRGYHRVISSILTKAVKWGYIPFNPAANAEPPKVRAKEAAFLDEADARRLLIALQDETILLRAAVTFDMLSGLRRGELLGLRWQDVDFEHETVTIVQTSSYASGIGVYTDTPKNRTSSRPLKLSRSAFLILREYKAWQDERKKICGDYWKDRDGRVFTTDDGAPLHPDTLSKWFRGFVKRNGFPDVHIHSLRHTYASLMIADGTPLVVVSRRMGHAQVSTTANIYAHAIRSADEKAAQVAERFADVVVSPKSEEEKAM